MSSPSPSFWSICKAGFRRNRVPAVILQLFAGAVLLLYFLVPGLRGTFEAVGQLKTDSGAGFAIVSTAIFGGLIPWGIMVHRGRISREDRWKHLIFFLFFWGLQGAAVDWLYTQQTHWFGSEASFKVLLTKMLVDQGPYNLIWATPNSLILYGWKDAGFSWETFWRRNPPSMLGHRFLTIQVSAWVVWIPSVLMVYSLPPDLQIPLFNLVLCFFSLVLAFVSKGEEDPVVSA
ncbi:MAG: hypothetical protein WD708_08915 [Kiritimatiellia bacterium]